jgi:two-component system phosphate regulon sensor histidine kinase PhoR
MSDFANRWKDSYRVRLAVGYLLIVVLFASAWAWSLFGPLTAAIVDRQQDNLVAVAQAGVLVLSTTDSDAATTIERLVARTNLRMTLVAADGSVLADSEAQADQMENHGDRPEVAAALAGDTGFDRRVSETLGEERIYVAVPAGFGGERAALRVSESLSEINEIAASARRFGLVLLAAALGIALLIVGRLTASASAPVERLSEAARAMAAGNLSVAVAPESGDLSILSNALTELRGQMKRRLEDLQAEQHNLRTVLDGLTDAVFLLYGREIRFANSAAGKLFRVPSTGWRGKSIEDAGLPASLTIATETTDDDRAVRITETGPDAVGRHLRVMAIPLNPTELSERTLVVISDITERTRVDRVRRDFVANASHELKTPAAAIQLLAESAGDAAADGDTDQALAFAAQIAEESRRLARLVADLLDLSRLEGAPKPDSVTDVRDAVANALLGHRIVAAQRGLELTVDDECVRGTDLYAHADPTDVAVAFDNLLDNAVKYTESGGVTVALQADHEVVRVSFSDTGIGIPTEDLPRIFERFYRVDRARSRASGGTGLGLALVRHVVERSDGSVEVSSEPGGGSTFTVTLPRAT